jgi:hypothetical protein
MAIARKTRALSWSEIDKKTVIHHAALHCMEGSSYLSAVQRAQEVYLPAQKHLSRSRLGSAKAMFGKEIDAEMERIREESMVASIIDSVQASQATPRVKEIKVEDVHVLVPSGIDANMDQFVDHVVSGFTNSLTSKLRTAITKSFQTVGEEIKVSDMFSQDAISKLGGEELDVSKIRVGLIGESTDNVYFEQVAAGLQDVFEFVPVRMLGETRKLADCQAVVMTKSVPPRIETAAKAISRTALFFKGQDPLKVNNNLLAMWAGQQVDLTDV